MLIQTAEGLLMSMLDDAGVHPGAVATADVRTTVEVFRRFAALPVDDAASREEDGDAVLAQFGTHDLRGEPEFSADLTRQFVKAGDEHAAMWQLTCSFHWAASAETGVLGSGHLWSLGDTLDEFFVEAVALPGWAWALDGVQAPRDLTIALEEV